MVAPPAPPEISLLEKKPWEIDDEEDSQDLDGLGAMFLYEKRYDALQYPSLGLKNELNGTCQSGQLLLRGYVQELHNGRMLRRTYVNDEKNPIANEMTLFNLTNGGVDYNGKNGTKRPYEIPYLYVRADDDQRTIMSGQVLLRGLFGDLIEQEKNEILASAVTNNSTKPLDPTIVIHTADRWRDILSPNSRICPRLSNLTMNAQNSKDYIEKFINSTESRMMNELIDNLGGNFNGSGQAQDCLMTTICNDRNLPNILDDYGREVDEETKYGTDLFQRLQKFSFEPYNYILLHNDAEFSKVAFGPLWVEILSNILPHLKFNSTDDNYNFNGIKHNDPPPKLSLFSAHDDTILPLLASLGEEVWDGSGWAPYASIMAIEIHEIDTNTSTTSMKEEVDMIYPSHKAFRLVYNGKVLTMNMKGCPVDMELCDISILLDRILSFAGNDRNCEFIPFTDPPAQNYTNGTSTISSFHEAIHSLFSSWRGAALFMFIVGISGYIGGLITYVTMTGRFPNMCPCFIVRQTPYDHRHYSSTGVDVEDDVGLRNYDTITSSDRSGRSVQ